MFFFALLAKTRGSAEPGASARAADRLLPRAEEVRRLGDLLLGWSSL
jgi:hypothetical protein